MDEASKEETSEPAVSPDRFYKSGYFVDHWESSPSLWDEDTPERQLLSKESVEKITQAIEKLPATQRQVVTLRDIEGLSTQEMCNILEITETNQRVLLHRARGKLRRAMESYVEGKMVTAQWTEHSKRKSLTIWPERLPARKSPKRSLNT